MYPSVLSLSSTEQLKHLTDKTFEFTVNYRHQAQVLSLVQSVEQQFKALDCILTKKMFTNAIVTYIRIVISTLL